MEELFVARHIGVGRFDYIEKQNVDEKLNLDTANFTVLGLDSVETGKGGFMMMVEKGYAGEECNMTADCYCNSTRVISGSDLSSFEVYDLTEKYFTFRLAGGVFSVSAEFRGYNEQCNNATGGSKLVIKGTLLDPAVPKLDLSAISAELVGTVMTPYTVAGDFQVVAVQMWQLAGRTYLLVAPGYSENDDQPTLRLFVLDQAGSWSEGTLDTLPADRVKLMTLTTFRMKTEDDKDMEVVHLFLVDEEAAAVEVYEWSYVAEEAQFRKQGELIQKIGGPSITALEVMKVQPTKETNQQILLTMALRIRKSLVTSTFIMISQYQATSGLYMTALLPNTMIPMGLEPIKKMKSRKLSESTDVLIISRDSGVMIHEFIPNQGLPMLSHYEVEGRLLDMAVYEETLPRSLSKDKSSTLIYLLSELMGRRKTVVLSVQIRGKINLPEIVFTAVDEGF